MPDTLPRAAQAAIDLACNTFPVVALTGARQTGKSTLLSAVAQGRGHTHISLDRSADRAALMRDPAAVLGAPDALVMLDEVQREPGLILALKEAVDAMGTRRRRGAFLLTGSADLHLSRQVADSLAGRAGYVRLWPLCLSELRGEGTAGAWELLQTLPASAWRDALADRAASLPRERWRDAVLRSGFPDPALQLDGAAATQRWMRGYVDAYIDRDLRELAQLTQVAEFRRCMSAAALRVGQRESHTALAGELGVSAMTVRTWLGLLETSYHVVRLPAWVPSHTARVAKSRKLYWADAALAMATAGSTEPTGFHLENLVLSQLLVWRDAREPRAELLYWRTANGAHEVDLLIETAGGLIPIEVKATTRPSLHDARGILAFHAQYPGRSRGGLVLHDGTEVLALAPGVVAAPWWVLA
jgi:predicted AAA+ superfamily ATPase